MSLLTGYGTEAQPTLLWQKQYGSRQFHDVFATALRLSPSRWKLVYRKDTVFNTSTPYVNAIGLMSLTAAGDSTDAQVRFPSTYSMPKTATLAHDGQPGDFYVSAWLDPGGTPQSYWTRIQPSLFRYDSTGHQRWRVKMELDTGYVLNREAHHLLGLPGGVITTTQRYTYGYGGRRAQVRRYDQAGEVQWERLLGYRADGIRTVPLRDGTYWVVANDYTQNWRTLPTPTTPGTYYGQDIRLMHLSATGDSLGCVWWGSPTTWEDAVTAEATADGGLVLTLRWADPPSNTYSAAMLVKFDSTATEQWRYTWPKRAGTGTNPPEYIYGNQLYSVQELTTGHFVLCGYTLHTDGAYYQLWGVAPPDATHPQAWLAWGGLPASATGLYTVRQLAYIGDTAQTVRLFGETYESAQPNARTDLWLAEYTHAGQPAQVNYCAILPSRPRASYGLLMGDSLTFTLQQQGQTAGPPLAELSLIEWDFGDGSPPATGWVVTHHFAAPAPVAVRLRVCNNLGCCQDTTLYPFGIPTAAPAPLAGAPVVTVFPNPSATGVFTLRGAAGATATVVDALGRRVLMQPGAAESAVDLSSQPAGVYALRLVWPDGRTRTKRLLR